MKLPGGPVVGQLFPADLLFRRDFSAGQMARDMVLFVDDDAQHTAYRRLTFVTKDEPTAAPIPHAGTVFAARQGKK